MTQITSGDAMVPVTLLRVPQITISYIKTPAKEGYSALVLDVKSKNGKKTAQKKEFPCDETTEMKIGDVVDINALEGVASVKLMSVSKGKGFTGAMKRWNFQ